MGLLQLGSDAGCLGADDGVGIFFMLQLIESKVPGTYIFHTAEECGAEGSRSINEECGAFTSTFDLIVAFDRAVLPGQSPEVIVTQSGKQCASNECGQAIANALNAAEPSLGYVVSHRGVFTDTLNYASNVAECLNIGCFYCDQHTSGEFIDVEKVNQLLYAILTVQWDTLPTVRAVKQTYSKQRGLAPTDNWWDKYGSKGLDDAHEEAFADQAEEVMEALEYAMDGDTRDLLDLMCASAIYLYDISAQDAQQYIRAGRLTAEVCDDSMKDLMAGTDPDLILSDLYDYCCN